jgi:hypothetical protein
MKLVKCAHANAGSIQIGEFPALTRFDFLFNSELS